MFPKLGTSTTGGQGDDISVYTDRALNKFDSNCKGGIFQFQFPLNSSDNLKRKKREERKESLRSVLKYLKYLSNSF